ncbi:MAG TPA: nuclear transport factor 2 family protein [Candidatus Saccharimonadales bacterium]|nr:nuclear transport factor 2 family protein [Candidatus Saccharimonadales bacterium]
MMKTLLLFLALSVTMMRLLHLNAHAHSEPAFDSVFKTIQSLDTRLFDAYSRCDLTTISSMADDDLEFYHDKTGLARGRQALVDGIKNNICGKVTRKLVQPANGKSQKPNCKGAAYGALPLQTALRNV